MSKYLVHPAFDTHVIQDWVVDADSKREAIEKATSGEGELVGERVQDGGDLTTMSEAEEISEEEADEILSPEQYYTVVGTIVHHLNGFIRVVKAESAEDAASKFDDPDYTVIAVLEDAGMNQL